MQENGNSRKKAQRGPLAATKAGQSKPRGALYRWSPERKNLTQRRKDAKVQRSWPNCTVFEPRQLRTPSALARTETNSVSKLMSSVPLLPQPASRAAGLEGKGHCQNRSAGWGEALCRKGDERRGKLAFRAESLPVGVPGGHRRTPCIACHQRFASLRLCVSAFFLCFFGDTFEPGVAHRATKNEARRAVFGRKLARMVMTGMSQEAEVKR